MRSESVKKNVEGSRMIFIPPKDLSENKKAYSYCKLRNAIR